MREFFGRIVWAAVVSVLLSAAAVIIALLDADHVSLVIALSGAGIGSAILAGRETP